MTKYKKTPEKFRKAGEETHGKGKHKAHRVGERISFKTPKGRTSGKIVAVHKEFYTVVNKNIEYKVNRNSILYLMGTKRITDARPPSRIDPEQIGEPTLAGWEPPLHTPYKPPPRKPHHDPYISITPPRRPPPMPPHLVILTQFPQTWRTVNGVSYMLDSYGKYTIPFTVPVNIPQNPPGWVSPGPILNDVKYDPRGQRTYKPRPRGI